MGPFGDPASLDGFWAQVCDWGLPDVVVNNAAIMHQSGGVTNAADLWDQVWDEAWRIERAVARPPDAAGGPRLAGRGTSAAVGVGWWV